MPCLEATTATPLLSDDALLSLSDDALLSLSDDALLSLSDDALPSLSDDALPSLSDGATLDGVRTRSKVSSLYRLPGGYFFPRRFPLRCWARGLTTASMLGYAKLEFKKDNRAH